MSGIEIIPVEYGKSTLPENMVYLNGSTDKRYPIVFMIYLIKTTEKLILVDAGCVTMPDFDMVDFIGPVNALKNMGISPDDITDVIITHSHHDHIECVSEFKSANIFIQKDEYNAGKSYITEDLNVILFDDEIEVCKNVRAIKIGGHSIGSCIVRIDGEEKPIVITGDECYLRSCLTKQIPTGTYCCLEKSKDFIKEYSSDKYKVLLCHDK